MLNRRVTTPDGESMTMLEAAVEAADQLRGAIRKSAGVQGTEYEGLRRKLAELDGEKTSGLRDAIAKGVAGAKSVGGKVHDVGRQLVGKPTSAQAAELGAFSRGAQALEAGSVKSQGGYQKALEDWRRKYPKASGREVPDLSTADTISPMRGLMGAGSVTPATLNIRGPAGGLSADPRTRAIEGLRARRKSELAAEMTRKEHLRAGQSRLVGDIGRGVSGARAGLGAGVAGLAGGYGAGVE